MKQILMVPLPAYGHINPLFELAKKLCSSHKITIVVPEYLTEEIRSRGLVTESEHLALHVLQDGYVGDTAHEKSGFANLQGLMDKFVHVLAEFMSAVKKTDEEVESAIKTDILIVDNFLSFLASECHEQGIPVYHFNTASARGFHLKGLLIDSNCPIWDGQGEGTFPLHEDPENTMQPLRADEKAVFIFLQQFFPLTEGVIMNSSLVLESKTLARINQLPAMEGKKVFMIGPLIPHESPKTLQKIQQQEQINNWMKNHEKNSVIYVSFGSIIIPRPEILIEVAKALLLTGKPFIWSLSRGHDHLPEEIKTEMKNQFNEETNAKFLILNWAPQRFILNHPSTGLFISHCGWNSTLEAISSGVPVVAWPMFADQAVNAKLLTDHGVAVAVEKTATGMKPERIMPAEDIVTIIHKVMDNPAYREKATELASRQNASVSPGGDSSHDLERLLMDL